MFSRKFRIQFNLPRTGPLGMSEDQQRELRRINAAYSKRKGTTGLKLERLFMKAWKNPGKFADVVKEVERANPLQDLREMTDAIMYMKSGRVVKIQLTARMANRIKFENEFRRHGMEKIALVELSSEDSYEVIRYNTISNVSRFLQYY